MFKIKRNSQRNLNNKQTLTESQHNIPTIPYPDKVFRRPPTAKSRNKQTNQVSSAQTLSQKSLQIHREIKTAEDRLTERSNIESQIRNICSNSLKDKCRKLAEGKQALITKVLEKAIIQGYLGEQNGWKLLEQLTQLEIDKIAKRRQCKLKYEDSLYKIQNMLDERINKLQALR